jgi:hypothetical protein
MADDRFHFIELVLRPLRGNPPARELARGELMDRLAHADPASSDDTIDAAIARLEGADPLPWRQAALFLGGLCLLLAVLLPLLGKTYGELKQLNPAYHFLSFGTRWQRDFEARLTAGMNPEERLFLLANTRYADAPGVVEWQNSFEQSLPSDPAWLEEAILTSESPDRLLRERMDQLGASLEPDNGFWDLLEFRHSGRNGPLLEAFIKPRIESHIPARTKRRIEMLGRPVTLADQVEQNHFLFLQRSWPAFGSARDIMAHSRHGGTSEDWIQSTRRWAKLSFGLPLWGPPDSEFRKLFEFGQVVPLLEKEARGHALWNEEARLKRVGAAISPLGGAGLKPTVHAFPGPAGPKPVARSFSSLASNLTRNQADRALPGTFTAEEFKPGRLAEHAVFDRFMALSGAILFVFFGLLAALEGWRRLPAPRGLAAGLLPLLKPVDVAWGAVLGIFLPLAWHIGITRFTPLGCRHLGLMEWDMMPGLQQASGSLLFSVCMLNQTVRWRLAKRAAFIGLRPRQLWAGWAAAGAAALFVPVIGLVVVVPPRQQELFLVLGSAMLGIPLLWLIWRAGVTALQPQEAALEGVLISRLLVPAYASAAALLLMATPLLQAEERRWVAQDALGGPATDGSLMQAMDARAIQGIRQALRDAWQ